LSAAQLPDLGIRLPNSGPFATVAEIGRVAAEAARLRFDTLWVHDHISWPQKMLTHFAMGSVEACQDQPSNFFESLSTCAYLAGRFPDINVGVAGLVLPMRDPRLLAKQLATTEQLTGSRLVICPVVGNIPEEFEVVGAGWKRRGAVTRERLAALRAIFEEDYPMSFTGEDVSWQDGTFYPRPARLPIWIAASSEPGFRRAVDFGDGWMTVYVSAEEYSRSFARIGEIAAESGRDLTGFRRAYETFVCVGDTHEQALKISQGTLESNMRGLERGLSVCLIGTVDEVLERIDEYSVAGADHLELKFICQEVPQMLDMMASIAERRAAIAG
jgi:alkanesulfonate monooxygenase SsuD/methylene tetrahydromethanopterin reductase-like flavin-dependent oxidoreductase (luciferase family)